MKTLLRLSRLIAPLFPVMALAVIFGSAGFLCAIAIPSLGVCALFCGQKDFPLKILVLLGVARGVLHYAEQYCNHFIAFTLLARIRNIVFDKLRALGPAKLDGKQKGTLISILTSDIELLELFYAHTVSPVCIALLTSAAVVFVLLKIHFALALLTLVFYALLGIALPALAQKISFKAGEEQRSEFAKMNSFLIDTLRGILQTLIFKNQSKRLNALNEQSLQMARAQEAAAKNEGACAGMMEGLVLLADISVLFFALFLFKSNAIAFPRAVFSVALVFSSFGPVLAVSRLGASLSKTVASGKRVLSLLDEKPLVEAVADGENLDAFFGAQFDGVSFSYGSEQVLSSLSLSFPKNKIIGLRGRSGSGKSTALKLLMRFYDADGGQVKISGRLVQNVNTDSLRRLEGYVTQETTLFHDTIENNIRIARLSATRGEIESACKKAAMHEFISSLPKGYQTMVSELGDNFSGGERQRLALARAFLHDGELLLLDEPTSNVDSFNEKIILDSVAAERRRKTVVLVSHRESALAICDQICKIENGRKS